MRRRYASMVLTILVCAVLSAGADDFWVKKDWRQWSKNDCDKILQDSPWTKKWAKGQSLLGPALSGVSGAASEGAGGEEKAEMDYFVQLRSSLAVREAVVREAQIKQKYDQMDADHKKAFDDQSTKFLSATYDDVIAIHVEYKSNVQAFERQLATYWQSIPDGTIPVDLYMISQRNERIDPVRFVSPHSGAYSFDIYFPRLKGGEPVIQESDKSFGIQFIHPAVGTQGQGNPDADPNNPVNQSVPTFGRERVYAESKLDKMKIGGKVSY